MNGRIIIPILFVCSVSFYLLLYHGAVIIPDRITKFIPVVKDMHLTENSNLERISELAKPKVDQVTIRLHPCNCSRTVNTNWKRDKNLQLDITVNSTCGDWATARGLNQKVVSYAIFGKFFSNYYKGLTILVGSVKTLYPGWTMRVYHDHKQWEDQSQLKWACPLACNNPHLDFCDTSKITDVEDATNTNIMLWRIFVLGDPTVDRFIVRDADSPILQREVDAVAEWIDSGKKFHAMRDHPGHRRYKVMGGMWGGWNGKHPDKLHELQDIRMKLVRDGKTGTDQAILRRYVQPRIMEDGMRHDSYGCLKDKTVRPFPSKRIGRDFIGMCKYRNDDAGIPKNKTCPLQCRPKDHPDWLWC